MAIDYKEFLLKKPITVTELIEFLKEQPQDLMVAYCCCSEQVLLETKEIIIVDLCKPRPDGWVHDERPDKEIERYLLFPGN